MHELSIAQELLSLAQQRLAPGQRLGAVHIAVGELASIEPEQLRFAFEMVVVGTPHTTARLDIAWHAARQTCPACGDVAERQPGTWLRLCPHCASPLQIVGGDELDLLDVEPAHELQSPTASLPTLLP